MTEPRIDQVSLIDDSAYAGPGDDPIFVGVRAAGRTGWYGPISAEIGHYVSAVLADVIHGMKVRDHSGLHASLRAALGSRVTATESWAVGALDCATWDLHGRLDNVPVAALLSDRRPSPAPLYASWLSLDLSSQRALDTVADVGRGGWLFTKWSLRRQPGRDPDHDADELARSVAAVVTALERPAAFDAVFTWNKALLTSFATRANPAHLRWLEDPLPDTDSADYRTAIGMPLAVGERIHLDADISGLLAARPAALTLDVVGCGGITPAISISAITHAAGVPVYPHGRSFTPGVHLAAAFPERIPGVEYQLRWEPSRQRRQGNPTAATPGTADAPTQPGLGITPRSR